MVSLKRTLAPLYSSLNFKTHKKSLFASFLMWVTGWVPDLGAGVRFFFFFHTFWLSLHPDWPDVIRFDSWRVSLSWPHHHLSNLWLSRGWASSSPAEGAWNVPLMFILYHQNTIKRHNTRKRNVSLDKRLWTEFVWFDVAPDSKKIHK